MKKSYKLKNHKLYLVLILLILLVSESNILSAMDVNRINTVTTKLVGNEYFITFVPNKTILNNSDSDSIQTQIEHYSDFYCELPVGYELDIQKQYDNYDVIPEWYRGKRFVRIRLKLEETLFENDSITIVLHLKRIQNTTVTRKHLQSDTTLESKVVSNSTVANNEKFIPLNWNDTTGNWIEYDKDYLKFAIPEDGIYRVTKSEIQQYIPFIQTIDPRTFRIFNKGREIELYVAGENDGSFDDGDYIEFPGLKNYSEKSYRTIPNSSEEYPQFMNRYIDTSFYWLTWGGTKGKRVLSNYGVPFSTDTLTWYPELIHIERDHWLLNIGNDNVANQYPYWQLNDMWCWGFLGAGGTITIEAQVNNLQPGVNGKVYARFANYGASSTNPHMITLSVNNSPTIDSILLNRFGHALLTGEVSMDYLRNGINKIDLRSAPLASGWNSMVYDWFELEYPRKFVAVNDSIIAIFRWLSIPRYATITISGFTSSRVVIYRKSTTVMRIEHYQVQSQGTDSIIVFSDTVYPNARYFAFAESKLRKPIIKGVKRFVNLRSSERAADYILITAKPFLQIANEYCSFVQQTKKLRVACVDVQDIFDEYGYGYPTPESIREFLKSTTRWQSPMPTYVFLVGDGTYDFKYALAGSDRALWPPNFIPPYGYPVSDVLFTVFEEASPLPQMCIGRLPAQTVDEFANYFRWYREYVSQKYDLWNKTFLLFTGGDPNKPAEIESFKNVNQSIINQYIQPAPLGGKATHFYKTISPPTNMGPYTIQQIQSTLDSGAIMINYIGHSGTQTWDNGITLVSQLKNRVNRYPLIADFGCSTARFAESNIRCFGELFVTQNDAPAIGYIGNTALGFVSFAQTIPVVFYETILRDGVYDLGTAHLLAKIKRINAVGGASSMLNQILLYTNTLLGEPALELALPKKTNFNIKDNTVIIEPNLVTDQIPVVQLITPYLNTGAVVQDSFRVRVVHTYQNTSYDTVFYKQCPLLVDTLKINFSPLNQAGEHRFTIILNEDKKIEELDWSDNKITIHVPVLSNAFQLITILTSLKRYTTSLTFLNPLKTDIINPVAILQIDTADTFDNPRQIERQLGTIVTTFDVPFLQQGKKYYWRVRLQQNSTDWSCGTFSFGYDSLLRWEPWGTEWNERAELFQAKYFPSIGLRVDSAFRRVNIIAASYYEGSYGSVKFDGNEALPNTFWWGHSVIVLDTITIKPKVVEQFQISESTGSEANRLASFLENLPNGTVIIHIVSTDGAQGLTSRIRTALKSFGSIYIDSLKYRDSWIMIGRKGSLPGTAREVWHRGLPNINNPSTLDTVVNRKIYQARVLTSDIGPAGIWNEVQLSKDCPGNSGVYVSVLGKNKSGTYDTLVRRDTNKFISLESISPKTYPYLRLLLDLQADSSAVSPTVKNVSTVLGLPSELAINQNTVTIDGDSLLEGNTVTIKANVFNVGEVPADSFRIIKTLLSQNGVHIIDSFFVPILQPDSSITITSSINTKGLQGPNTVIIKIDPDENVVELFKGNNIYTTSFYVRKDTISPAFDITFDGKSIMDGDYVLSKPTIRITIRDNSPMPINESDMVLLKLDNRRVFLSDNPDSLFVPQTQTENAYVLFRPTLKTGTHTLEVRVKDVSGNWSDTSYKKITFNVETEMRVLHAFAYPNPFANGTYFTFNIVGTTIPDIVSIKIYSLSGRLIKTLQLYPGDITPGFNRVYWDGRDQDGDEIANGVYLYKIIMRSNSTSVETIQKLAKVR